VGIRCADHVTPSIRRSRHYFADSGGRSIGIVRLRTKATEFFFGVVIIVFILCSVSFIVCVVLCAVFRLIMVLFCVMCVICLLCFIT
jgi:hypothetical protein